MLPPSADSAGQSRANEPRAVTLQLAGSSRSISPGKTLTLGVEITIPDNAHIYWSNPGESGLPTVAEFQAPAGFQVGPVQYPAPARFHSGGGLDGYGYQDTAALFAAVTAPANLPAGDLIFSVEVTWLACSDVCIKEQGRATTRIAVTPPTTTASSTNGTGSTASSNAAASTGSAVPSSAAMPSAAPSASAAPPPLAVPWPDNPALQRLWRRVPTPAPETLQAEWQPASLVERTVLLSLPGSELLEFYGAHQPAVGARLPVSAASDGALRVTFAEDAGLLPEGVLRGVVKLKTGGAEHFLTVAVPAH